MVQQYFNRGTLPAIVAICIVAGTIFYSNYLAEKIAEDERKKVEAWVEAGRFLIEAPADADTRLPSLLRNEQQAIPIIETDEKDSLVSWINLDSVSVANDPQFVRQKLKEFKSINKPVVLEIGENGKMINKYYYGHSRLLKEVRYYPMIQLLIVALFIFVVLLTIQLRNKSTQNQVWVGMAKETAHQLGTPVSSLQGWLEMLKESAADKDIVAEIGKDVERLRLISERFGKIGGTPHLEPTDLWEQLENMITYMKRRASGKVIFHFECASKDALLLPLSPPLFDWVIENLIRNALDSMEGKGAITLSVKKSTHCVYVDVRDTGKGIPRRSWEKIFKPGYTTKKRGWGLGLSLSKRIIEQYHKGELYVKYSEQEKGTTFRIVLPLQIK
ncbi:MAG: HAMP domain-containing histidine kinase [Bacteroidetes bacterium]|nr:HAMP domain-containing histidine kinase [Bacteroidota bacterium]